MVGLADAETIREETSDLIIDPRGAYLGGDLKFKNGEYFFYRQNTRYTETIAGYFGKKYGFGMDSAILQHMWKYEEDYDAIYIETEFNIWRIPYKEFLDKCIASTTEYFHLCSEENFHQYKKYDPSVPANERNYNNDPLIKREADHVNKQAEKNGKEAKGKKKTKSKKKETATEETDGGGDEEASMDNESDSKSEGKPEKENSKGSSSKKANSKEKEEDPKPGAQQSLF